MTKPEASARAIQLHKDGMTYPEISLELAKEGYKSSRNKGKPFSNAGIAYLVKQGSKQKAAGVSYERFPAATAPTQPPNGYVMVVIGRPEQMRDIIAGAMK